MPIRECMLDGKKGFSCGDLKCYTYTTEGEKKIARQKAINQCLAIGEPIEIVKNEEVKEINIYEKIKKQMEEIFDQWVNSEIIKEVTGDMSLGLATRNREWDGTAAEKRVREWATMDDNIDFEKYKNAFFYRDGEKKDNLTAYKLGFADVINGELIAIPRGIFAVAGVLQGARGGVHISQEEQNRIKGSVEKYYTKMREKFDDDSIVPTWEIKKEEKINKEICTPILKADDEKMLVTGIVLEPETEDSQGDVISEEEIEKAAHFFLEKSRTVGNRHNKLANANVVESYVVPQNIKIGEKEVKKGTWVLTVKINDEVIWEKVKNNEFNSFSVGGYAIRSES